MRRERARLDFVALTVVGHQPLDGFDPVRGDVAAGSDSLKLIRNRLGSVHV